MGWPPTSAGTVSKLERVARNSEISGRLITWITPLFVRISLATI